MTCTVETRQELETAADRLAACEAVRQVDVLAPAQSPSGRWTVEVTVAARTIPPAVERTLADCGLSIRPADSGTSPHHAIVVAQLEGST